MLETKDRPVKLGLAALVAIIVTTLVFVFGYQEFPQLVALFLILLLILFFSWRPIWGIYVLSALGFFLGWEIVFSKYQWAHQWGFLSQINAPLVDLLAIPVLIGVVVALLLGQVSLDKKQRWMLAKISFGYILFLLLGLLSNYLQADHFALNGSIKYWLRPVLFSGLGYFVLLFLVIRKKTELIKIIHLWMFLGVAMAVFGLISLFMVSSNGWWRAVPFAVHGFAPLGYNHNLLAQALIPIIPLFWFFLLEKTSLSPRKKQIFWSGLGLVILVGLLTLSRAFWLALAVQVLVGLAVFRQVPGWGGAAKIIFKIGGVIAILALVIYMAAFLFSPIVSSSTFSRWETIRTVFFYTGEQPWLGYGSGRFEEVLNDTYIYTLEFGPTLDAHGFWQKMLLENGILGLLAFLGFLGYLFFCLYPQEKDGQDVHSDRLLFQALFLSALGAVIFQIFNTSYYTSVLWLPLGLAVAGWKLAYGKEE